MTATINKANREIDFSVECELSQAAVPKKNGSWFIRSRRVEHWNSGAASGATSPIPSINGIVGLIYRVNFSLLV
jgi:hypothetical protein